MTGSGAQHRMFTWARWHTLPTLTSVMSGNDLVFALQWKTFQADRTPLFDRIIATMGSQVGGLVGGWPRDGATGSALMLRRVCRGKVSAGGEQNAVPASNAHCGL